MRRIIKNSVDHELSENMRRNAILGAKHVVKFNFKLSERQAIIDELAAWPRAQWFELVYVWCIHAEIISQIVVGTDCSHTATYIMLRFI